MILIDLSSILHRMIYTAVESMKPKKENNKFVTSEFIAFTKFLILQELFSIKQQHENKFGEIVICLDNAINGYWRKDFYPLYKSNRVNTKEESEINYREVFKEINNLIDQIRENLPWKVVDVQKAEADDLILVLSREFNKFEKILIYSPDKDMIQAQRDSKNVSQYSSLTKKWITPENKHDNMEEWILEHVCLGDECDGVPKVVDHTEFSHTFVKYLNSQGYKIDNPFDFKNSEIPQETKRKLLSEFDVYKTNRKGESIGVKDVYKDIRFGPTTLQKRIKEFGTLEKWLETHPLYKQHYERNYTLVMEEGIPSDIWNKTIAAFKEAKTNYNSVAFETYLKENDLKSLIMLLPSTFKINRELTAEDFGW